MMLFRKTLRHAEVLPLLALTLALACAAHAQSYDVSDDGEEGEDGDEGGSARAAAPVDYSRYFGAGSAPSGAAAGGGGGGGAGDGSGFVQPIDFSALLANAQLGQAGQAVAASSSRVQDFFRAADASNAAIFALPTSTGVFSEDPAGSETQNNGTGFTSPAVRFPSLFDASPHSDEGFRPQDFLQVGSSERQEATPQAPSTSYSPSFAKLNADYRPQTQASYTKAKYAADTEPRAAPAAPARRPYLPLQSAAPSALPSSSAGAPRPPQYSAPALQYQAHSPAPALQYQAHSGAPALQTSLPVVPLDIYGSKVPSYPRPAPSEPHVGKSSYPGPLPVDYTAKPKAVHDAPTKINPEYFSLPAVQPSAYLPTTAASLPKIDYNVPPTGESYSATNQQGQKDVAPKNKKCTKIDKTISTDDLVKGRFRRNAAMTCYVCEDPKTGGNYEECSYATEPKAEKYFIGHAQSYSTDKVLKPQTYRYRRQVDPFGFGHDSDHELYFSADSSYKYPYASARNPEHYHFREEDFVPTHADYSAAPTDKNCEKVQKESMTCFVCKDPKTGGSYEQCSYAVEPKANNYFVARESSFSSKDKSPYLERYRRDNKYDSDEISRGRGDLPSDSDSPREERRAGVGLDPFLYGEPKHYDPKEDKQASSSENIDNFYAPYRSYEEYFSHLFPELVPREASASSPEGVIDGEKTIPGFQYKTSIPDYFTDTEKKKDLDAVLGEFTSKDRTDCKKVQKDKMTCYQCIDKKGMQHEECMFVAASEPKSQHLAYKEVKEFNLVPHDKTPAGSSDVAVTADAIRALKSAATALETLASPSTAAVGATLAASAELSGLDGLKAKRDALVDEMVASASEPHTQKRRQANSPPPARRAPSEPAPPELSELDRSPDGLYSAETRHRFDPVLKVTLPEYMLTRSEHEAIFDEVMASGR